MDTSELAAAYRAVLDLARSNGLGRPAAQGRPGPAATAEERPGSPEAGELEASSRELLGRP